MTTHDALLAAVLANPADDLPRLVLADWLDEHGESERAEFIRVQVERSRTPDRAACDRCRRNWSRINKSSYPVPMSYCESCRTDGPFWPDVVQALELRRREKELFDRHATTWFGDRWAILVCGPPEEDSTANHPDLGHAFITRGFVSEYHGPMSRWCGGEIRTCTRCNYVAEHPWEDRCPSCNSHRLLQYQQGIGTGIVRLHPLDRVELVGVVRPLPDGWAQITRRDAGILYDVIFPGGSESDTVQFHIGQEPRFLEMASAAAIAWAKYQPTHAVYHGDGQTYCIVPTRA